MEKQGFFIDSEKLEYSFSDTGLSNLLLDQQHSAETPSVFYLNIAFENEKFLPISIFRGELTPFQAIIKHLKEHQGLKNKEISLLLKRDIKSIWITYNHVKDVAVSHPEGSSLRIPLSIFRDDRMSAFEALVQYLRNMSMSFAEISRLTGRDQRTIWTVFSRVKKKIG